MDKDIRDLLADDDFFDPFESEDEESAVPGEDTSAPVVNDDAVVAAPLEKPVVQKPELPAEERFANLLAEMPGTKRLLLKVVDFCRTEKTVPEMDDYINSLKEYSYNVYSPVIIRELLQEAGAIDYIPLEDEDATYADEETLREHAAALRVAAEAAAKADVDFEGGVLIPIDEAAVQHEQLEEGDEELTLDFMEIEEPKPGLWIATEAGLAAVDAMDDYAGTQELLAKELVYLDIYHQILSFCAEEEYGRSSKEIDVLVNDSPLLEKPRRYSGYFVSRLERQGALEWRNGWCVTEVGKRIIAEAEVTIAAESAEEE